MDDTPNLKLPYILAAQAQKHVTHNEAIRALDALVQISVADKDLSAPPGSPAEGVRYIVGAAASGSWAGKALQIAAFQDGAWAFYAPREGFLAWVADEDLIYAWTGTAWIATGGSGGGGGGGSVNPAPLVGVNTTAAVPNRLAVKSDAILFSHDDVTPGSGDMQAKINKATAGDTASLLFQTAFSGRAELGLAGDDNFHVKVSANGSAWKEALVIDRATGEVSLPFTDALSRPNVVINGDFQVNQRVFAGGALAAGAYGHDRWGARSGGCTYSVAGYTVTLASGELGQVVEAGSAGLATFANVPVTISLDTPSADVTVRWGNATGTITAGSGRRSVTLTSTAAGNTTLGLARAAGSVSFGRVKVELGTVATDFVSRGFIGELTDCLRFYEKSMRYGVAPAEGAAWNSDCVGVVGSFLSTTIVETQLVPYMARKRAVPTLTFYRTNLGGNTTAGRWVQSGLSTFAEPLAQSLRISPEIGFTLRFTVPAATIGDSAVFIGGYTADAELAIT